MMVDDMPHSPVFQAVSAFVEAPSEDNRIEVLHSEVRNHCVAIHVVLHSTAACRSVLEVFWGMCLFGDICHMRVIPITVKRSIHQKQASAVGSVINLLFCCFSFPTTRIGHSRAAFSLYILDEHVGMHRETIVSSVACQSTVNQTVLTVS